MLSIYIFLENLDEKNGIQESRINPEEQFNKPDISVC